MAIRRPGGTEVAARMIRRQIPQFPRVHIQNPDVGLSAAARNKGQEPAVGREGGLIIEGWIVGQAFQAGAVLMHAIDIGGPRAIGGEDDPLAVARE